MPSKKIVCLGAGSGYFRGTLPRILATEGLAGSEVTLYDIFAEKAELMAGMGRRLSDEAGTAITVRACAELADAVDGADFAVSAIGGAGASTGRVYGTEAHRHDLVIPAKYGIYQIVGDTGGPAGMMMGLRSVPIYLDICHELETRAPNAVMINHSNPMAVLCRAMVKYTKVRSVIGICHGVQAGIGQAAKVLDVPVHELDTTWIGTNHYYWFTRVYHQGRDVYPELRRRLADRTPPHHQVMTSKLSEIYGHEFTYRDDAHVLEFYPFLAQLRDPSEMPYGYAERAIEEYGDGASAAEPGPDAETYLKQYADDLAGVTLPTTPDDPLVGEGVPTLIEAIASGRRHVHIVNIPNRGSVPNLPADAVLEIEGVTDSCGVRGVYTGEAPLSLAAILQKRIAWQELVADAAATGDRNLALQALLLDEMAVRPEHCEQMLDELLAANADYLPQFQGSAQT